MEKKEQILIKALELFANEGFNPVTTSRLAQEANVSEGLIFKHFKSKQGLFEQLIIETDKKLFEKLGPIISESDPKNVLRNTILMPSNISLIEYAYWRFHFKLKWYESYDAVEKIQPLVDKVTWAFTELGYENPGFEAEIFMNVIEASAIGVLRDGKEINNSTNKLLLRKYNLLI